MQVCLMKILSEHQMAVKTSYVDEISVSTLKLQQLNSHFCNSI